MHRSSGFQQQSFWCTKNHGTLKWVTHTMLLAFMCCLVLALLCPKKPQMVSNGGNTMSQDSWGQNIYQNCWHGSSTDHHNHAPLMTKRSLFMAWIVFNSQSAACSWAMLNIRLLLSTRCMFQHRQWVCRLWHMSIAVAGVLMAASSARALMIPSIGCTMIPIKLSGYQKGF